MKKVAKKNLWFFLIIFIIISFLNVFNIVFADSGETVKTKSSTLTEVFIGSTGDDTANNGATHTAPVKTFAKAKELLADGGKIIVVNDYIVSGNVTWDLSGKGNAVVEKYDNRSVVIVPVGQKLTLSNITLKGKDLANTALINIDGGSVVMTSGAHLVDNGNIDTVMTGGVSVRDNGNLEINAGSSIKNCQGQYGGAISIDFTSASSDTGGSVVMNGGEISGGYAYRGGAVHMVGDNAKFTMNGGIINNSSNYDGGPSEESHHGGAIAVFNGTKFEMSDGKIYDCKVEDDRYSGGAFLIASDPGAYINTGYMPYTNHVGQLIITGGEIYNNFAKNGGAICVGNSFGGAYQSGSVEISGGKIHSNTAYDTGGAIYIYKGIAKITGNALLKDNISQLNPAYGQAILLGSQADNHLYLSGNALIDSSNDVCVATNKYIEIDKSFKGYAKNPVVVTSYVADIEDESVQSKGTKLVEYSEVAGGANAAQQADLNRLFIANELVWPGHFIGQSAIDKEDLVYVATQSIVVTYDCNLGKWDDDKTILKVGAKKNDKLTEPTIPAREGYFFTGWYKEKDAINLWSFEEDIVSEDITLYAGWKEQKPPHTPPSDPPKPENPTDPPKPPTKPKQPPKTPQKTKTSDATNPILFMALIIAALAGAGVTVSKMKRSK